MVESVLKFARLVKCRVVIGFIRGVCVTPSLLTVITFALLMAYFHMGGLPCVQF